MKKILIMYLLIYATSLFASDVYTVKNIKMQNIEGANLALVTKGTKVKVLKVIDDKSLIEIKGWSYAEEPNNEVFYKDGVTVVLSTIDEDKVSKRKIYQTKEDAYEEIWIENSIQGFIATNMLTKDFKSLWMKESSLASERCSGCHEIPEPDSHFAGEFPSLLDSMAEQAGLSSDERYMLINYFQKRNIYKQ